MQEKNKKLVAATVRDTIEYLSQAFRAAFRDNPVRDPYGSLLSFLEQTFKGYVNKDSGVKEQKAIPIFVLLKVLDFAKTEVATVMTDIICAVFFLTMRPCEYNKSSTPAEIKIIKIITLGNIGIYRNNRILRHDQDIENADWVNITFKYKKKMTKLNLPVCTDKINSVSALHYALL